MRRLTVLLIGILLIAALCIPVWGANYASKIQITANVGTNESCQVTVVATLHIEENNGELTFPVPKKATAVSLNGSRVHTHSGQQGQYIDISKAIGTMTGDFTITVTYSLPDVIEYNEADVPQLQLPLLAGYEGTISRLDFAVSLPGEIQAKPAFSSGYHLTGIEEDLSYSVNGTTVTGFATAELKDHETLTMYLNTDPALFPKAPLVFKESGVDDICMIVCGVLALLYWLIFLRAWPDFRTRSTTAPEGLTAGEVGAVMTLGKADLSLMVFSWAQLGYIQMQISPKRVILHKQMDMGNERSSFEQVCFGRLFKKRAIVDTGSLHYALLCRAVEKLHPPIHSLVRSSSGNGKLFRLLAALMGLFCGLSFGIAMTQEAAAQWVGVFLMAAVGFVCSWCMQPVTGELFLRKSSKTVLGLIFAVVHLIFGIIAGQFSLALGIMLLQWLAGIMAAFGGRRTDAGKQDFSRVMGLRRYLVSVSKEELSRIEEIDPEYFHTLAPFALALGVNSSFAHRFGKGHFSECPYIDHRSGKAHTAREWSDLMEQALKDMNRRSRLLSIERFMAFFQSARK